MTLAQTDMTIWLQFGAMGVLACLILVVLPRLMGSVMETHRKALEDVAKAARESNSSILYELRSISHQIMRLALALAAKYPGVAKEIAASLEPPQKPLKEKETE